MADVKWIKLIVGMFDGMSFKKIKKAKIGGESFRDKLTAVWFELMDFAGRCNHDGAFISPREIPFYELSDIATMIDREEEELRVCMAFFIKEGMITVIDDVYMLSNWSEYQNVDGLEKIKEQNRLRQANFRQKQKLLASNVTDNVTVTQSNAIDKDIDKEIEIEKEKDIKEIHKEKIDYQQIIDLFNTICTSFPSVRSLSDARKKAIKARLNTYTVDDFKECFENAEASSFLKGGNNRNWTATFDWLIKDSNMAKVLDGNYNDAKDVSGSSLNNVDEFVTAALSRGFEDLVVDGWNKKEQPKTAADDESIKARAEALKQQFAGK
jgi:predicted phage replisome organizer